MDKIPFEEQRVIDELVELWQTYYVPRDLARHINGLGSWEVTNYFRQVCKDLYTEEDNKNTAFSATFSASEFKRFLETEYRRLDQIHAEHQAQAKEKAEAECQAKARADFDALGKEMAKATTRTELVEIGRKRADLAPHTGVSYVYTNHCWNCQEHISSAIHAQCSVCRFYICSSCGSCFC